VRRLDDKNVNRQRLTETGITLLLFSNCREGTISTYVRCKRHAKGARSHKANTNKIITEKKQKVSSTNSQYQNAKRSEIVLKILKMKIKTVKQKRNTVPTRIHITDTYRKLEQHKTVLKECH